MIKRIGLLIFSIVIVAFIIVSCGANKELVMQNENLSSSLKATQARNEELQAQLGETQASLSRTDEELETLKKVMEEKERELADLQNMLAIGEEEVADLGTRLGDVREELQKAYARNDSLETSVQELSDTLTASGNEMARQITQLTKTKRELEKQIIDLKSDLDGAMKKNEDLAGQIARHKTELQELKTERVTFIKTIGDLNATFKTRTDDLTKQVSQLTQKNENLEKQIASLGTSLDNATRMNTQQNELIIGYRTTIEEQRAGLDRLESETLALEEQIALIDAERQALLEKEEQEKERLKATYEELLKSLESEVDQKTIQIESYRDALTINIMDQIFFESGKADVKKEGRSVLDRIAPILKSLAGKIIRIEGHTDDIPIGPKIREKYPSNWELAAARSSAVARYFIENHGIDPTWIVAVSYSYYRPLVPNTSEENRARNRRIEIVLTDKSLYEMVEMKGSGGTESP